MQRNLAAATTWWTLRYSCPFIRFAEGPFQQWNIAPCCVWGVVGCGGVVSPHAEWRCNRLCMMSWSVLLSHVLYTCDQSGGTEERFLRLQNDRWLAGPLFLSFPSCHDISPTAHVEKARFFKTNIAISSSLCVLFLRKVQYRILSEI